MIFALFCLIYNRYFLSRLAGSIWLYPHYKFRKTSVLYIDTALQKMIVLIDLLKREE